MIRSKEIFVYAEAPPIADDMPAPGLYRASVPILKAIGDHIATIALYPQDRRYGLAAVHPELRGPCRSLHAAFTWFRLLRRRLGLPCDLENNLVVRIVGEWAKQSGASQILALEGSDPEVLARVDALATSAGLPFSVYLVDDFEWTMRLNGSSERQIGATRAAMQRSLSRARHVFAITDELGAILHKGFGVRATTLRLVAELRPPRSPPRKDQIFFLGSINFLYISALRTLLEIVAKLRAETGRNITVRFTYDVPTALDPLPDFVRATPIADANLLDEEIAASLFAFLPYAFEADLRTMVETSFPSKSMECLAHARSVVVYAPEYSNLARFFTAAGLPVVTGSPQALEREIRRQLVAAPDHRAQYRNYLAERHGVETARETLLSALLPLSS